MLITNISLYVTAVISLVTLSTSVLRMRVKVGVRTDVRKGFLLDYSSPSISGVGKAGVLFRKREALPLARRTARPWYRCLIFSLSSCPVCLARADPIIFPADWSYPGVHAADFLFFFMSSLLAHM